MTELFLRVVNLSYSALWIVLAVVVLRLVLRKAPKWIHVLLWALVAVRLLLPFSVESGLSLQPSAEVISPAILEAEVPSIHTGLPVVNYVVNPVIVADKNNYVNQIRTWIPVLSVVWIVGVMLMLAYSVISYLALRRKVRFAEFLEKGVFYSDLLPFSFILGLVNPKIYVSKAVSEQELPHVLAHERAHIRRKDHVWKPFGFLLLAIHWFNPALWLAYVLLCRDIELACDEKVIKELGTMQRADYSQTILNCGVSRRRVAACPLAFGEVGAGTRIRRVLHYKKPGFWILLTAALAIAITAICLLTVPEDDGEIILDGHAFRQMEYLAELPRGAKEIGRVMDSSDAVLRSSGLPKRYDGLPVYRHDSDPQRLYLPTSKEFLCFYSASWRGDTYGPLLWVDRKVTPADTQEYETTLLEFPGITFRYTSGTVSAIRNGEESELFVGMPIWDVYFVDLNGDGYREICSTVSFGSGVIDEHVVVLDYRDGQLYTLWERGEFDYSLRIEDSVLICDKRQYPRGELVKSGPLTLSFERMKWKLDIGDSGRMVPTDANLKGVFDGYLYLEGEDGLTYRYERSELSVEGQTKGALLDMFTEKAAPNDVQWQVYAIEEIPDRTSVIAVADGVLQFRYDYSPSRGVSGSLLTQAKEEGYVVLEDGEPTHGQERWQEFYEATLRGETAAVEIARWYTLDPETCDATYYEAFKEDYPCMYYDEIRFDGTVYQLINREDNRSFIPTYEYLMRYETEAPTRYGKDMPQTVIRYVLTHDEDVTWEELFYSLASSTLGAYIDHYTVYTER